ncbi:MAG TPA: RNA polymerase sigma factor [Verrucomicrobiae bacterium]|nr:RNA polymerase sigma factor [Verrucomicrobiae bacterium]
MAQPAEFMSDERSNDIGQIVTRAGERVMGFIRARVGSQADAEDILQDVWRQLITALEDGPIEHVLSWLYTTARNRIIDQYRKPKMASLEAMAAESELEDDAFEVPEFLLREASTPESENLRNLFWEQLQAALAELPQEQRQVFVWHELDGLSFQQIAALTGENLNTLLSRKRYAVLHLRQRFQRLHDEFLS